MNRLNKLERKFDWLAFPGLFKCLTIIGALVYAISWTKPEFGLLLTFDKAKILAGEWWRIPTFLFAKGAGRPGVLSILFFFCAISFAFTISDSLERVWGVTRTTLFFLFGWLSLLAGSWLLSPAIAPFPSVYFYTSAFLAFAWHHPEVRMLFPPIPCGVLAVVLVVLTVVNAILQPWLAPFLLIAHLNALIWVGPEIWQSRKNRFKAGIKRREFQSKLRPVREAFHTCSVCQRTEHHAPSLDFRVGYDGREYCDEHLPS
ncbi:MAG TPA: hypothetical protein VIM57_09160 [Luteolibacter sp.]